MSKNINTVEYLYILVKWRRFIVISCLLIAVLVAGVSLIVPHTYKATSTILPPAEEQMGMGVTSLLRNLPLVGDMAGSMFGGDIYIYMAILDSRIVMERIVKKFDLQKRYHAKDIENTIKTLRKRTDIALNDEGTLSVSASATTRWIPTKTNRDSARLAASQMVNYWINQMDSVNRQLRTEKASDYRRFIEKRYQQNLDELGRAEEAMNVFQTEYGVVDIPEQMRVTLAALSELKAQIIAKEVETQALLKIYSTRHAAYQRSNLELNELKQKYSEYTKKQFGQPYPMGEEGEVLLNIGNLPDLGLQYARLYREIVLQETLLEFILPQYEQARLQEAKDTPTVQVLDPAVPPILRAKPKRGLTVILSTFVGFMLCVTFIFTVEYFNSMEDGKNKETWNSIFAMLKSDLRSLKKK